MTRVRKGVLGCAVVARPLPGGAGRVRASKPCT